MHALIIETQYFTAMLIEDCLRPLGYGSFSYAMDEEEAVARAITQCPDLITADPELTFGCGIAAVQRICRDKPIPVLYITAAAEAVSERCPEAVVILKPFGLKEMREGADAARSTHFHIARPVQPDTEPNSSRARQLAMKSNGRRAAK